MARRRKSRNNARRAPGRGDEYDKKAAGSKCPVGNYDNDAAWYGETPALIRDSASLSYGYPLGKQYIFEDNLPGIMSFKWIPAVGISDNDGSAPVNLAARNIYSFVRHANSGHSNYDSPDLMLYLLCMDSLYYTYAMGVRAYGLARQFCHVNRYWGKQLVEASGFDYDSVIRSLADFRLYLNTIAKKLGSMCVPDTMPYFKRHVWMCSNVFTDSPQLKSQLYMYTPKGMWYYNETDGAGKAVYTDYNEVAPYRMTFNQYRTLMDTMMSYVIASEDLAIMSGDILKAFGTDKVIKLSTIDVDYVTPIVFNPEVLTQIQNLSILGAPSDDLDVIQDPTTGILSYNPRFSFGDRPHEDKYITMPNENVTPEQTMVATRLTVAETDYSPRTGSTVNQEGHTYLEACGSEIVCGVELFTQESPNGIDEYNIDTGAQLVDYVEFRSTIAQSGDHPLISIGYTNAIAEQRQNRQEFLEALSKFASHPAFWYSTVIRFNVLATLRVSAHDSSTEASHMAFGFEFDPDEATPSGEARDVYISTTQSFIQDIDNFTVISNAELTEMHTAALLSMFGVPAMGAWNDKFSN